MPILRYFSDAQFCYRHRNIGNRLLAGDDGNYWEVICQKNTFGGYVIAVDLLTGDARLEDVLK